MRRTQAAHRRPLRSQSDRLSAEYDEARRRQMRRTDFDRAAHLLWGRGYAEELATRKARRREPRAKRRVGIEDARPKKSMTDELQDVLLQPDAAEYGEEVMRALFATPAEGADLDDRALGPKSVVPLVECVDEAAREEQG